MEYELCHHGVKGMKWGVRRAQKRSERADRAIRRIQTTRKQNKLERKEWDTQAREKYSDPKKAKKLQKKLATNKTLYDRSEKLNNYAIAIQKAKKDKSYKETADYKAARKAYTKQFAQDYIYGTSGSMRIDTLKNMGVSDKKAKGRVIAEQTLAVVGTYAVAGAIAYASTKR